MPRSYKILGQELAPSVLDWGASEEIKEILLAQAQLFMGQHEVVLENVNGRFSPKRDRSIFKGRNTQQVRADLSVDGLLLFSGFVRSIDPDSSSRSVRVTAQNVFTIPANSAIVLVSTEANPASLIKAILEQVGLGEFIDPISFNSAGAAASTAGATISVNYAVDSSTTALGAIQDISSLCSMSCYVQGGLVRLKAWRPYQGSNEGIKYNVTPALAREFGQLKDLYSNLVNSVTIIYGADLTHTQKDFASIRMNGIEVPQSFSAPNGAELIVPNLASAKYFAGLFLQRSSTLKQQGSLTVGPELIDAHIGDRILVSDPLWSTDPLAMEIVEVHQAAGDSNKELSCVTI